MKEAKQLLTVKGNQTGMVRGATKRGRHDRGREGREERLTKRENQLRERADEGEGAADVWVAT